MPPAPAPPPQSATPSRPAPQITPAGEKVDIIVAGALAVDFSCDYAPLPTSTSTIDPAFHTSNPAVISQTLGGVAYNIAKATHLLGSSVRLCSAIGDDLSGRAALSQLEAEGMQTDGIQTLPAPGRTAQYVAVNNAHKDLTLAMADMSILESISPDTIASTWHKHSGANAGPKCVIVDANWDPAGLHAWLEQARSQKATTMFEPVSTAKATRLFEAFKLSRKGSIYPNHLVDIATPNTHELLALHNAANDLGLFDSGDWFVALDALGIPSSGLRVPLAHTTTPALVDAGIPQQAIKMLPFIPTLLTKLGPDGVLLTKVLKADDPALSDPDEMPYVLARNTNGDQTMKVGGLYVRLFPTERVLAPEEVVSVNGIGDTFLGALASGLVAGKKLEEVIPLAQRAAALSLKSKESVSPELKGLRALITGTNRVLI